MEEDAMEWQMEILKLSFICTLKFQRDKAEVILARMVISKKLKMVKT